MLPGLFLWFWGLLCGSKNGLIKSGNLHLPGFDSPGESIQDAACYGDVSARLINLEISLFPTVYREGAFEKYPDSCTEGAQFCVGVQLSDMGSNIRQDQIEGMASAIIEVKGHEWIAL